MATRREKWLFALSLLWLIAASVTAVVFLSIPLFALDIGWEHLTDVANMSWSTLMHNYNVLMAYELNPFIAQLHMPNFPDSASALKHFAEVRQLFMLCIGLTLVLLPAFIFFIKRKLTVFFGRGIKFAMAVPIILAGIAALIGFDNFFILFHEVLFRDNTWLFDPVTDPIINVLTDQFFMVTFILFGIIYETVLVILLWRGRVQSLRAPVSR